MKTLTISIAAISLVIGGAGGYWLAQTDSGETATAPETGGEKISYWVAPMDPNFRRDAPGKSPMGMDLIPVYEGEEPGSSAGPAISIDPAVVQNLGIRAAKAEQQPLNMNVSAVGIIVPDDNLIQRVDVRSDGWIEEALIKTEGEEVQRGDILFRLYSRPLVNAQTEFLQALRIGQQALAEAARQRLEVLGMTPAQIDRIAASGTAERLTDIRAPQSGTVIELSAREGQYVKPGTPVMSLANLSQVWVMVDVFEGAAAQLKKGDQAVMNVPALPGQRFTGAVDYVYPTVNPETRTVKARLAFANAGGALRPNLYADVALAGKSDHLALTVPRDAVIRTEHADRVILDLGGGRFRPAEVVVGRESGNLVEIVDGLRAGETVVTSGQFLLDSEASLDAGLLRLASDTEDAPTKMEGMDMPAENGQPAAEGGPVSGTGRVTAVQPEENRITLAHDPIPEINWPSMTMGFAVNTDAADDLKPGDQVEFDMMKMPDGNYVITGIRKKDSP